MSKKDLTPLVSVIVPTYNSQKFLEECLESIKNQSYKNIEIIVVDNNSTDNTKKIAKKFTDKVFNKGPERSAQRNFGVKNSQGQYVAIIDSDMNLEKNVIAECIDKIYELDENKKCSGIIIPEKSFGKGFWAECKTLERSFYEGVDFMEAARFFFRSDYITLGGYDELLTSGEDWDLSQRMDKIGILKRINSYILIFGSIIFEYFFRTGDKTFLFLYIFWILVFFSNTYFAKILVEVSESKGLLILQNTSKKFLGKFSRYIRWDGTITAIFFHTFLFFGHLEWIILPFLIWHSVLVLVSTKKILSVKE